MLTESAIASKIGSMGFKWAIKGILGVAGTLLVAGLLYFASKAASYNPDVLAAKSDVDALKTEYTSLKTTADSHTLLLGQMSIEQQHAVKIQERIFTALEDVSTGVHGLDVQLSAVNQKVTDQGDAINQIRQTQTERK